MKIGRVRIPLSGWCSLRPHPLSAPRGIFLPISSLMGENFPSLGAQIGFPANRCKLTSLFGSCIKKIVMFSLWSHYSCSKLYYGSYNLCHSIYIHTFTHSYEVEWLCRNFTWGSSFNAGEGHLVLEKKLYSKIGGWYKTPQSKKYYHGLHDEARVGFDD